MAGTTMSAISIALQDGMRFDATNARGAVGIMDSAPEGEQPAGLSPMEYLLAGLGGCTGMDVISILRKKRLDVTDYRIEVEGERASEHPRVYRTITVRHIISGHGIPEEAVRHAVELSEEKYCSVHAMLDKAAEIRTTFEVRSVEPVSATL